MWQLKLKLIHPHPHPCFRARFLFNGVNFFFFPPSHEIGQTKNPSIVTSFRCFVRGEDFEPESWEVRFPSPGLKRPSWGAGCSGFLGGGGIVSYFVSSRHLWSPLPPSLCAVNGGRLGCWYAEVGDRKSRSGFSERRALYRE